jgi:acylglycerol lipase
MTEGSFQGVGGLKIFTRSWRPAGKPRAIVAIVHGFNSHSGQYLWVGDQLAARGFAVHAFDHRGRGRSDGERFYVDKFTDYVDDVATMVNKAKAQDPGLPVFVLGHSAGGVIACGYTLAHQAEISGLICESFAFEVPAPDIALAILKGIGHIAPHAHIFKLKNEDFSRDPAVVKSMNDDPLIADENQAAQTVAEMVRADEYLRKNFGRVTLPVFILHGTLDKATKPSGSRFFYENAGSKDKTLRLYEGHFHDLLNDIGKEKVMADVIDWMDGRIPVRQTAAA